MNRAEFGLALCAIAAVIAAVAVTAVLDESEGAGIYILTIDPNDGSSSANYEVGSGTLVRIGDGCIDIYGDVNEGYDLSPREGYSLVGWEGSDGNTYYTDDMIIMTSNLTLTAVWESIETEVLELTVEGLKDGYRLGSFSIWIWGTHPFTLSATGMSSEMELTDNSMGSSYGFWLNVEQPSRDIVGSYSIVLTGTATDENVDDSQATVTLSFTIYNRIVSGDNISITSLGTYAQTSEVAQNGDDLDVVWSITDGTLPEGFSFASDTGVISGTYTGCTFQSAKLTLTVSSTKGPEQTATRTVTIYCEPAIALSGSTAVTAIVGTDAATYSIYALAAGDNPTCSAVTWYVNGYSGLSVSNGVLHVDEDAEITSGATVTVQAVTALGGSANRTVTLTIISSLCAESDPSADGVTEAL